MEEIQYTRSGEIRCWSCMEWMSNNEFSNADGYCIHCDAEIDATDMPYTRAVEPS